MKRNIYGCIIALLTIFGIIKNEAKPSEYEGRKYKLNAKTPFYIGLPPSVNQSGIHKPNTWVLPCFVLVFLFEDRNYLVFKIKANTCAMKENQAKNGTVVYYEKGLFNNLGKEEIT